MRDTIEQETPVSLELRLVKALNTVNIGGVGDEDLYECGRG